MLASLLDKRIYIISCKYPYIQNLGIDSPNQLEVYAAICKLNDNMLLTQAE